MSGSNGAQVEYDAYYQMLADTVRMDAFRKAIFEAVSPGDTVIDLGAGLGILGFWALQAGAAKIYCIEKTESIELARRIAQANGLEDRVVFMQQLSTEVELPERADVLVSETLGPFGVDENLLPFIIDARDRLLKPGGRMIPQGITLMAAPAHAPEAYQKLDFWRRFSDLDLSPAFELFSSKIFVEHIPTEALLGEPAELAQIDLRTVEEPQVMARHYFAMERGATLHGVAGWFVADLGAGIELTNAPGAPQTHWKQAFLPFREAPRVIRGDYLDFAMYARGLSAIQDGARISYEFRCTQLLHELRAKAEADGLGPESECLCGSGSRYGGCCLAD